MAYKNVISGIYLIRDLTTFRTYIGSSVNILSRWSAHKHDLRRGKHHSKFLQRSWDKYGEENFKFDVLQKIEPIPDKLAFNEQSYIMLFEPEFNSTPKAISKNISEATRGVVSQLAVKRNKGFADKSHTKEACIRRARSITNLTEQQLADIKRLHLDGKSCAKIGDALGITEGKIALLVTNKNIAYPNFIPSDAFVTCKKISEAKLHDMMNLRLSGMSTVDVGLKYGYGKSTICSVVNLYMKRNNLLTKENLFKMKPKPIFKQREESGRYKKSPNIGTKTIA